jgi:hypothetical protein
LTRVGTHNTGKERQVVGGEGDAKRGKHAYRREDDISESLAALTKNRAYGNTVSCSHDNITMMKIKLVQAHQRKKNVNQRRKCEKMMIIESNDKSILKYGIINVRPMIALTRLIMLFLNVTAINGKFDESVNTGNNCK